MGFFSELKRRNVFKVGIAYVVMGWIILQVVSALAPLVDLPDWLGRTVLVFLAIGFPLALFFAWAFELTSDGVKRAGDVAEEDSIAHETGKKLEYTIIAALVIAVGFLMYDRGDAPPAITENDEVSIAVLPFVNMSADPDQIYFSDGISEEILNVLVQIPDLRVTSRSSAFQFRGGDLHIPTVAQQLGVAHVLEGSVRKSGTTIRITAQLIDAATDSHLWSEVYERELTDVFAIQEEIATAIVAALALPLGLEQGRSLVEDRTRNIESYENYLQARRLIRTRGAANLQRAYELLLDVTANEPDYAPGWAALSLTYHLSPFLSADLDNLGQDLVRLQYLSEQAARRAVSLNPNLATAHHVLANALRWRHVWVAAEDEYLEAMRLDPTSVEIIEDYGEFLAWVGKVNDGLKVAERGVQLAPTTAFPYLRKVWALRSVRRDEEALETILQVLDRNPGQNWASQGGLLSALYIGSGRYQDAIDVIADCGICGPEEGKQTKINILTAMMNGDHFVPVENLLLALSGPFDANLVYLVGGEEAVINRFERYMLGEPAFALMLPRDNSIYMDSVRTDIRYKEIVVQLGLVNYWRERGWPDYCHPTSDYDFECGAYLPGGDE